MALINNMEETRTCPFNPSHRLQASRFQTHLVKCRQSYPHINILECKYNSTHLVQEAQYQTHLLTCSDRYLLDRHLYVPDNVDREKYPVLNVNVNAGDSWDNEDAPTYNPEEYCKKNNILRKLDVASEGRRKNFRMEERRRHQALNDVQQTSQSELEQPLRRPVHQSVSVNFLQQIPTNKEITNNDFSSQAATSDDDVGLRTGARPKVYNDDGFQVVTSKRGLGKGRGRGSGHKF